MKQKSSSVTRAPAENADGNFKDLITNVFNHNPSGQQHQSHNRSSHSLGPTKQQIEFNI